ncbi:putative enzyme [Sphingomonas sp. T1]|uniref:ABC transporter ATP-binding protein n=1 Tax=Sphingomonas sp. T1 TaxID=2653172 RepID=UPI0012F08234|nr:ABC transporter ATP-binding protein [Sphingomonas sp. T1]VXC85979.1 putative enzyme [Sphingomonas sp. T1]
MNWQEARAFVIAFCLFKPRASLATGLLVAIAGLVEALGLVLIIPLLQIAGGTGARGHWSTLLARLHIDSRPEQITLVLLAFAVLMLVRAALISIRQSAVIRLELEFLSSLQIRLIERLGAAPWSAIVGLRHARVNRILGSDIQRLGQAAIGLVQSIVAAITLTVQLTISMLLSPLLTLLAVLFVATGALLSAPLFRAARQVGDSVTDANLMMVNEVGQFLGALKLAMSQNLAPRFVADFSNAMTDSVQAELTFVARENRSRLRMTVAGIVMAGGIAGIGLGVVAVPVPTLVALLLILSRMAGPAQALQTQALEVVRALPAYAQIRELEAELASDRGLATDAILPALEVLSFDRVGYRHPRGADGAGSGVDALDLELRRGEFLGVAGRSGAGKTSFADLLVGLYHPQAGRILLNGTPVTLANHSAWRDRLAYVAQDPFMRHASIRENLLWSNPGASDAAIARALWIADADDLLARLPEGLATWVGERGSLISGGERQRLALARAVLRDPQLLILDEATNAIDIDGEQIILHRLREACPDTTILMIAHRLESLRRCDRILLFDAGRVVAQGSFETMRSRLVAVERDDATAAAPHVAQTQGAS